MLARTTLGHREVCAGRAHSAALPASPPSPIRRLHLTRRHTWPGRPCATSHRNPSTQPCAFLVSFGKVKGYHRRHFVERNFTRPHTARTLSPMHPLGFYARLGKMNPCSPIIYAPPDTPNTSKIGRASCREKGGQYG